MPSPPPPPPPPPPRAPPPTPTTPNHLSHKRLHRSHSQVKATRNLIRRNRRLPPQIWPIFTQRFSPIPSDLLRMRAGIILLEASPGDAFWPATSISGLPTSAAARDATGDATIHLVNTRPECEGFGGWLEGKERPGNAEKGRVRVRRNVEKKK